jgi:hypothetical protein
MHWFNTHVAGFFLAPLIAFGALFVGFHATSQEPLLPITASTTPVVVVSHPTTPTPRPTAPKPSPAPQSVRIDSISPRSGAVGTSATITGAGFTADNIIFFGGGAVSGIASQNGTTLSFTVPESVGPYCAPRTACPMYMLLVTPREYDIHVQNANGSSNTVPFTVTGTSPLQVNE